MLTNKTMVTQLYSQKVCLLQADNADQKVCLLQADNFDIINVFYADKNSPDETCCFLKRLPLFKQPICDNVRAVYVPALHASDQHKQNTYLPQTRRTSMLQAAAASLTVPLQRIRCMTCRYQHHCHLIALCKYKCSLELELMQTLSKGTQQVALLITSRLIISRQVMASNIVLSGLLTSNIGMLAAIHTNTHRDCKMS